MVTKNSSNSDDAKMTADDVVEAMDVDKIKNEKLKMKNLKPDVEELKTEEGKLGDRSEKLEVPKEEVQEQPMPTPVQQPAEPYGRPMYRSGYGYRIRTIRRAGDPRPIYNRPKYAPAAPLKPIINNSGFDGVVDNRVIPDAGLPTEKIAAILEVQNEGHGLLKYNYVSSDRDVYVSASQIRRFHLRVGDMVTGQARKPKENEKFWGLLKVEKVNDVLVEDYKERPEFEDLTPIHPNEQIRLETKAEILSTRMIDLISPVGKGQRGLIVSPPKAGKTWLLKDIANGVTENHPEIHLMAILIGERPEEVTDLQRSIKGEVAASNFDETPQHQVKVAELALQRAKRLVEGGKDVLVLLDSITRLARAYNMATPNSGRTLSGGFDPSAIFPSKHFLGAARKIENGGSLTIIGTTLVETGSRMDDLIYEEFKGTGNMELHLTRKLANRRVFPAIDAQMSGTRQEELLYDPKFYQKIVTMRRMIDILNGDERTEVLLERLQKTKSNKEFLEGLKIG